MKKPKCPKCKVKNEVIPIRYGYPSPKMSEAATSGEIWLGGCVINFDSSPEWYCKKCEIEF